MYSSFFVTISHLKTYILHTCCLIIAQTHFIARKRLTLNEIFHPNNRKYRSNRMTLHEHWVAWIFVCLSEPSYPTETQTRRDGWWYSGFVLIMLAITISRFSFTAFMTELNPMLVAIVLLRRSWGRACTLFLWFINWHRECESEILAQITKVSKLRSKWCPCHYKRPVIAVKTLLKRNGRVKVHTVIRHALMKWCWELSSGA